MPSALQTFIAFAPWAISKAALCNGQVPDLHGEHAVLNGQVRVVRAQLVLAAAISHRDEFCQLIDVIYSKLHGSLQHMAHMLDQSAHCAAWTLLYRKKANFMHWGVIDSTKKFDMALQVSEG